MSPYQGFPLYVEGRQTPGRFRLPAVSSIREIEQRHCPYAAICIAFLWQESPAYVDLCSCWRIAYSIAPGSETVVPRRARSQTQEFLRDDIRSRRIGLRFREGQLQERLTHEQPKWYQVR